MENQFLRDFVGVVRQRFADDSTRVSMSDWICANTRHPKSKPSNPKPFSFVGYEFQRKITDDLHPDLCCIKVSQIGLTEIQARKFLAILKRYTAVTGIFTLPTDDMFQRVSKTRVGLLINSEPIFNTPQATKPIRSMGLYQIDQSWGYFTGNKEGDATSISADFLFHDELDLSDQANIALFQSRIANSTFKVRQKFSTPSYPGFGIDAEYNLSDQHEYLTRCAGCNHWQVPELSPAFLCLPGAPDYGDLTDLTDDQILSIDYANSGVQCERCQRPLNLIDPSLREWVPKRPGIPKRGYKCGPFVTNVVGPVTPGVNRSLQDMLFQLIEYRRLNNLRGWWNTTGGKAFADAKARLQEAQIRAVMSPAPFTPTVDEPVFMGVDMGQICHITVGTAQVVFHWERCHANDVVDRVRTLVKQYNVIAGSCDRHPYTPTAEAIRDATQCIVMPVEYRGTAAVAPIKDKTDFITHYQGARTPMIDSVAENVRKKRVVFAAYGDEGQHIVGHLQDMVREEIEPGKPAEWKKLTGKDHYFHSLAFLEFAKKLHHVKNFDPNADTRFNFGFNTMIVSGLETKPFSLKSRSTSKDSLLWPA